MVRLVFRPYTQIRRTICTSVSLRASTRVSPGFTLFRHSSPSFGSQHMRSHSNFTPKNVVGRWSLYSTFLFHFAYERFGSHTRTCVSTPWSVFQDGSIGTCGSDTTYLFEPLTSSLAFKPKVRQRITKSEIQNGPKICVPPVQKPPLPKDHPERISIGGVDGSSTSVRCLQGIRNNKPRQTNQNENSSKQDETTCAPIP